MWSPFALSPPRSVAPASTNSGQNSLKFGGTCTPTSGINRLHSTIKRLILSIETEPAHEGRGGGPSERFAELCDDGSTDGFPRPSKDPSEEGPPPLPPRAREASSG